MEMKKKETSLLRRKEREYVERKEKGKNTNA